MWLTRNARQHRDDQRRLLPDGLQPGSEETNIELTNAGRNEYEALVRDAKRYRWLRDDPPIELCVRARNEFGESVYLDGAELDAAIAAAYKKRQEGDK